MPERILPSPRLLKKDQAAAYCNLPVARFLRLCPIPAVDLGDKINRWDRHAIDAWLDGIGKTPDNMNADDWLRRMADGDAELGGVSGAR